MKVAIVILNYNGQRLLEEFLPDVIRFSPSYAEVIVADNASTDQSVTFLQQHFPAVRIQQLTSNTGFAGGYNRSLHAIEADYYILLNSDVEVTENWMGPIIEFMEQHQHVAVCQPKIRSYSDKNKFEHAGASGGFIDFLGYPFCRGRMFDSLEEDNGQYNEPMEIFWASGACMFIRSHVFHDLNGFDESFFAHMEEIDLCWRIKKSGHPVYCIPSSHVYHVGGGTLPKANPKKTYLNFRNNLMMLFKNLDDRNFNKVIGLRFFLDQLAAFKFLGSGQWKDALAVWKAYRYFLSNLSVLKEKRKNNIPASGPVSCIYTQSVVWNYYLQRKKRFSQLNKNKFTH